MSICKLHRNYKEMVELILISRFYVMVVAFLLFFLDFSGVEKIQQAWYYTPLFIPKLVLCGFGIFVPLLLKHLDLEGFWTIGKAAPEYDAITTMHYIWYIILTIESLTMTPPNLHVVIVTKQLNCSLIWP